MRFERIDRDLHFLIVDDAHSVQQQVTNLLIELDFKYFHYADDGAQAFKEMEKLRSQGVVIDVILLDINMPNMNGIEFLKVARAIFKDVPVIMISAEGDSAIVMDAITAGANQYILKPITSEQLKVKLMKIFE